VKRLIACLAAALVSGCICIDLHSSTYSVPAGVYSGTYYCAEVLSIPFRGYRGTCAQWVREHTLLMYPVWLLDLPLELVADTCTLPYDLRVRLAGGDGQ
jgi:uncharacterized protein YceK